MSTSEMQTWAVPAVSNRRLWFGTAGPIAAWVVEGMTSFVFSDYACDQGKPLAPAMSRGGVVTILIVLAVLMLLLALAAGVVSWRSWRELSRAPKVADAEARGRGEFMALSGIFISVVFSIAIVWSGLGPILLGPCTVSR